MSRSPIHKALSTFRKHRVRALLMGGQACVLYGAAEFSRDIDFVVLADHGNLERLKAALRDLSAETVFVPALSEEVLRRGHACHFRCGAPGVEGLRIDVMSALHGCEPFEALWFRRTRLALPGVGLVPVVALGDLVQGKKTQRDKDWPMVRRLVEADYYRKSSKPTRQDILFWLLQARTSEILLTLSGRHPALARRVARHRAVVRHALAGDRTGVERALMDEQEAARAADRDYWRPLRAELAEWRRLQARARTSSISRPSSR